MNGLLAVYILCRLRTTPKKFASMRYAGEWKLAGGNVDAGETIAHAAARELQEEFLEPLGFKLPKTVRPVARGAASVELRIPCSLADGEA